MGGGGRGGNPFGRGGGECGCVAGAGGAFPETTEEVYTPFRDGGLTGGKPPRLAVLDWIQSEYLDTLVNTPKPFVPSPHTAGPKETTPNSGPAFNSAQSAQSKLYNAEASVGESNASEAGESSSSVSGPSKTS